MTEKTHATKSAARKPSGKKNAPSRQTGRRSAEEAEETRQTILKVAIRQFSEYGFEVTSLRDIAAQAGVTHGIIRHHFGSKSGIWEKSAERIFGHYAQQLMPLAEPQEGRATAAERFHQLVSAFINVTLEHPEYTRFLVQEMRQTSQRADYCHQRFLAIHTASGDLFDQARASLPALQKFSNDTFFYTLMSLTCYHIINPVMSTGVDIDTDEGKASLSSLILGILFPANS